MRPAQRFLLHFPAMGLVVALVERSRAFLLLLAVPTHRRSYAQFGRVIWFTVPKMADRPNSPSEEVVSRLWESMQRRAWPEAGRLLAPELQVWWPSTGERFIGADFAAMNQAYPEGWTARIEELVSDGDRVAARVAVEQDGTRYWCFGFYRVSAGRIVSAVESWVTEAGEEPPDWRAPFRQD